MPLIKCNCFFFSISKLALWSMIIHDMHPPCWHYIDTGRVCDQDVIHLLRSNEKVSCCNRLNDLVRGLQTMKLGELSKSLTLGLKGGQSGKFAHL